MSIKSCIRLISIIIFILIVKMAVYANVELEPQITNVLIYDSLNKESLSLQYGVNKLKVSVTNYSDDSEDVMLTGVHYKNDSLAAIRTQKFTIYSGVTQDVELSGYNIDTSKDNEYIRLFIWSYKLEPYQQSVMITKNSTATVWQTKYSAFEPVEFMCGANIDAQSIRIISVRDFETNEAVGFSQENIKKSGQRIIIDEPNLFMPGKKYAVNFNDDILLKNGLMANCNNQFVWTAPLSVKEALFDTLSIYETDYISKSFVADNSVYSVEFNVAQSEGKSKIMLGDIVLSFDDQNVVATTGNRLYEKTLPINSIIKLTFDTNKKVFFMTVNNKDVIFSEKYSDDVSSIAFNGEAGAKLLINNVSCYEDIIASTVTLDKFQKMASETVAGERLYLKSGTYDGVKLNLSANGTFEKPVVFSAAVAGKSIFTGKSAVVLDGEYLRFEGFSFDNCLHTEYPGNILTVNANNSEIVNNKFYKCGRIDAKGTDTGAYAPVMPVYGKNNQILSNTFDYLYSIGVSLRQQDTLTSATHNRIAFNKFINIPYVGDYHPNATSDNGSECIQIAQGGMDNLEMRTVVEHNYFENVTGDTQEIISNKSSWNVIRYNTFKNSNSAITLRGGNNCEFIGNYLINVNKGLRVYGANHKIINNYFGQTADSIIDNKYPAIRLGQMDTEYSAADNVLIMNNTIKFLSTSNHAAGIYIYGDKKPISGGLIINNIIETPKFGIVTDGSAISKDLIFAKNIRNVKSLGSSDVTNIGIADVKPLLEHLGDGTYRPVTGSPAIGYGVSTNIYQLTEDIEGKPRGNSIDAGAFQSGAGECVRSILSGGEVGTDF